MISDFDLATYFELPLLSHSINMRHFFHLNYIRRTTYTFLVVINFRDNIYAVVKNLPTKAGDTRDVSLILGSGRSPGVGMATHSSILAWKISWTEEPGGLQSMGSQRVGNH